MRSTKKARNMRKWGFPRCSVAQASTWTKERLRISFPRIPLAEFGVGARSSAGDPAGGCVGRAWLARVALRTAVPNEGYIRYTTTVYMTPPCGGFPSSIARRPRGCQYRTTRRLRKAPDEMFTTPTFSAPTLFQLLSRYRAWEIGPRGYDSVICTAVYGSSEDSKRNNGVATEFYVVPGTGVN